MDSNKYVFSDDEKASSEEEVNHYEFIMPFGEYKGKDLAYIVRICKGRHALRYYLSWDKLRDQARTAITSVMNDYERAKADLFDIIKEAKKEAEKQKKEEKEQTE